MRWVAGLFAIVVLGACSGPTPRGTAASPRTSAAAASPRAASPAPSAAPTPVPTPVPTPPLPAYYIESLRARAYPGGKLEIGDEVSCRISYSRCIPGVHTRRITWPSGGQTMTGLISLPEGDGPFPVVLVNHGFIPAERYGEGQDSLLFGEPMTKQGFVAVYPHWPGYLGSGPAPPELPSIVGEVVSALDLLSSLKSLPQADTSKVACVGHSNGGGICQIAMVAAREPRISAAVLHAPISSDMADNGRKWWMSRPESLGSIGSPESNPDGYAHLSPRNYFQAGQAPVLIIQGTADHTIPREWTEATLAALHDKGVGAEVRWMPNGDHDLVGQNYSDAVAAQGDWVRRALHL